jgi:hypothetical protein
VGTGTSVSLASVHLGAVPALPLLAPLPQTGQPPAASWLLFAGILGAGVLTGWLVARQAGDPVADSWLRRWRMADAGFALGAGAGCGLVLGAVGWLSGGALGPGRMAEVGPHSVPFGLAAAAEVGVMAAATVIAFSWLAGRSRSTGEDRVFEPVQLGFDLPGMQRVEPAVAASDPDQT